MEVEPPPVPPDPDGSRNTSRQAASESGKNPPKRPKDDKGPFIVHVSRKVSAHLQAHPCLEVWTVPTPNKCTHIVKDGIKSVGRNRVSVEFSNAQAATF
ncbi:unnamed protein product [Leptidea sinapis]|uniref:Uncharacterized protein n=1 Tax=Leptidea sinapis TaxID=189913 RepID=A0A5E4Q7T6_9NEOP|nr:unnamed protein product [Leptidea sinapis]